MTHLSLFTGIGGLDLAAEAAGFETVGQCEWADYPTKVLEKHWPDVPRWRDIRTLTGESFYERTGLRTVDIISGGFPCQPFSVAGERKGEDDDRYLWPEMLRVISEIRPTWVIGENVAGIVNMALDTVLSDLEALGYSVQAIIIPACGIDAPHKRERVAVLAYSSSERLERASRRKLQRKCDSFTASRQDVAHCNSPRFQAQGAEQQTTRATRSGQNVADTDSGTMRHDGDNKRTAIGEIDTSWDTSLSGRTEEDVSDTESRRVKEFVEKRSRTRGLSGGGRRSAKPGLGGGHDGLADWMDEVRRGWADGTWEQGIPRVTSREPDRADRLKCLGNMVVPQQFYPIFKAIAEIEAGGNT